MAVEIKGIVLIVGASPLFERITGNPEVVFKLALMGSSPQLAKLCFAPQPRRTLFLIREVSPRARRAVHSAECAGQIRN